MRGDQGRKQEREENPIPTTASRKIKTKMPKAIKRLNRIKISPRLVTY